MNYLAQDGDAVVRRPTGYYYAFMKKWYEWFAHVYDPFVRVLFFFLGGGLGGEKRLREKVLTLLEPRLGEKILDCCCGTATFTLMIAERVEQKGEVVGVELSQAQLRVAQRKNRAGKVLLINADAEILPFSDDGFDKVVIFGALHEMPEKARQNVLAEVYRILKPEGRFVAFEQNKPERRWKTALFDFMERFNPEHETYKDMLKKGLLNEIERARFKIRQREITSWEFFQVVVAEKAIPKGG